MYKSYQVWRHERLCWVWNFGTRSDGTI